MEPFRVICETCRSRLKVRSADVIGEIHACPKCGSMVHIVPPVGWSAEAAATPVGSTSALAGPALTISSTASVIIPVGAAAALPTSIEQPQFGAVEIAAPVTPTAQSISPFAWLAIGSAAVLVVGAMAVTMWPHGGGQVAVVAPAAVPTTVAVAEHPETNAAESAGDQQEHQDPYAVDHSSDASLKTPPAESPESVAPTPAAAAVPAGRSQVATSPQSVLPEIPAAPAEDKSVNPAPPVAASNTPPPPKPTDRPAAAPTAAKAAEHEPVLKFDPLDFDPDQLSATTNRPTASTASTSSIPNNLPGETAPGEAASAAGVPDGSKPPLANNLLPPPDANRAVNVRRGPAPANVSQPHEVAKHLATRVKTFQVNEMPLARFVEMLSDMAGAPITLDPLALELVGFSPRAAVSVEASDATLEKILREALSKQRLDFVEQDDQVRVVLPNSDERRTVDYDVKDLVGGTDAAPIARLIERFVAPATWQAAGGAGTIQVSGTTLHIDQSQAVRREVLIFCERLRLARGRPLRSKYPAALLTVDSPYEKLSAKINQHTTFTFLAWARLADVVRQWQEMSGLAILVDWSALAGAELGPASTLACAAIDRPWHEALDGVLEPLGLGWRAVDGQTIQITSLEALEKTERIEFYPVSKKLRDQFATGDALSESLQKEISERGDKHDKPGQVRMELDEPSGRLIVRAAPDVHRILSDRLSASAK